MNYSSTPIQLPRGFIIRPMLLSDISSVYRVELNTSLRPWAETVLADCIRVGYYSLIVSSPTDEIIGFAITRIKLEEAHLFNLAIEPDYQGRGLGTGLMQHIIHVAMAMKSREMMLEVRASNRCAIHIYEKLGFVAVGRRHQYYPGNPPEDALLYSLYFSESNE